MSELVRRRRLTGETARRWERAVETRNKAVHGEDLDRGEVDELVRAMKEAIKRAGRRTGR